VDPLIYIIIIIVIIIILTANKVLPGGSGNWKEGTVAYFKILTRNLPSEIKKPMKISVL
jgi:hypothetical protein